MIRVGRLTQGIGWQSVSRLYSVDNVPKPFSEIPTPKGALPFLGHTLKLRKPDSFSIEMKKMFNEVNGPIFRLKVPGGQLVLVRDPEAMREIYAAEGQNPSRGSVDNIQWFYEQRNEEPHMTFELGSKWRGKRSAVGKQLALANVYGYVPGFNRVSDRLVRNIALKQDREGYVMDMEELVTYWSLEVGSWFSLGVDLDAMVDHRADAMKLKQATQEFLIAIDKFSFGVPIYKYIPTRFLKKANENLDTMYEIATNYADRHMEKIMQGVGKGETQRGQSLLEQWLIEGKQSKEEAVRNAALMVAAGMDTTANLVSFMFHELSTHKDVQDELHRQVVSVLGTSGEPDMETLQKIPYLMNIIKESQRLSSVIPVHSRQMPRDTTILGYCIPAGTIVLYSLNNTKDDASIYKNPEIFNPNRWSDDNIHRYASVPFGLGPRGCWGRRFAEIEMKVLLAKVSQNYLMESDNPPGTRLAYKEAALIRPGELIKIKFIARDRT